MSTLHPNLARVAAAYDDLADAVARGHIDESEARRRAAQLVARDDQGVRWWLCPDDGDWYRETQDLRWEKADPPAYGIPTVSPADVSAPSRAFNPAQRILSASVSRPDPSQGELTGSTWGAGPAQLPEGSPSPWTKYRKPAVALAVAVLVLAAISRCGGDPHPTPPEPGPSTSVPASTGGRADMPTG